MPGAEILENYLRGGSGEKYKDGEVSMFEYDLDIVETLLNDDQTFKKLYRKHNELKEKVRDAELGVLPLDDLTLGTMKKEKLLAKDRMAAIIEDYRRTHQ